MQDVTELLIYRGTHAAKDFSDKWTWMYIRDCMLPYCPKQALAAQAPKIEGGRLHREGA